MRNFVFPSDPEPLPELFIPLRSLSKPILSNPSRSAGRLILSCNLQHKFGINKYPQINIGKNICKKRTKNDAKQTC